jgi:hypothetical protein
MVPRNLERNVKKRAGMIESQLGVVKGFLAELDGRFSTRRTPGEGGLSAGLLLDIPGRAR